MSKLGPTDISVLFESLQKGRGRSIGEKAAYATLIGNHWREIDSYIEGYEQSDRYRYRRWGKRLRRLATDHSECQPGHYYNEARHVYSTADQYASELGLHNARRQRRRADLAYPRLKLAGKYAATAIKIGIVGLLLWSGYELTRAAGRIGEEKVNGLELLLYDAEVNGW
jgi:hypothetical protein